jgi:hypothetical protein
MKRGAWAALAALLGVVAFSSSSGRRAGQFPWVHNVAVDSKGNSHTGEVDNGKRVQKFKPTSGAPK